MRSYLRTSLAAMLGIVSVSTPVHADPGVTTQEAGSAAAIVADPITIQHISSLRFGRFAVPSTASTLRINPDGTFNATGDVANSTGIAQPANGRGPAQFRVQQAGNRGGTVYLPGDFTISNGTSSMQVTAVTGRLVTISGGGRNRVYRLDMGATLQVPANQASGYYIGDFDVTVIYN